MRNRMIFTMTPHRHPDYVIRRGDWIRWRETDPFIQCECTVGSKLGKHRDGVEVLRCSDMLEQHYVILDSEQVLREDMDEFSFKGGPWTYVGDVFSGCTVGSIVAFFGDGYRFRRHISELC